MAANNELVASFGAIAAFVVSLLTLLRQARKDKSAADRSQVEVALNAYNRLTDDLRENFERAETRALALEHRLAVCGEANEALKLELAARVAEVNYLQDTIDKLGHQG